MATPDLTTTVRVGTRRSALALKQTELVTTALQAAHPHLTFTVHAMATMGDKDKTTPLSQMGKGLWTSELEAQLTSHEIDVIVHSLKDMPTTLPTGCLLGCVSARADSRDAVVFPHPARHPSAALADLPVGSVVGTSSVRRAAQLRRRYPGLQFRDIRGNIDTRLAKCDDASLGYDCTILAAAGLKRMGFEGRIAQYLDAETPGGGLLHAVGQGALGLEVREGDERLLEVLEAVMDGAAMRACTAERSLMRALEGGCSVPLGVETSWKEGAADLLRLRAIVVSVDGTEAVEGEMEGVVADVRQAEELGLRVAQQMVDKGAARILDAIKTARKPDQSS